MKSAGVMVVVIVLAASTPAWAVGVAVTSPAAGSSWCVGQVRAVTWTGSSGGTGTAAVHLLRKGPNGFGQEVLTIAAGAPNTGAVNWAIPTTVPAGEYYLRVKAGFPVTSGESSPFQIAICTTGDPGMAGVLASRQAPRNELRPSPGVKTVAGHVSAVTLQPPQSIQVGTAMTAHLQGKGRCGAVRIEWGDGSFDVVKDDDLGAPDAGFTHTYSYWGGKKTVKVQGRNGCLGTAQAQIEVEPKYYALAYMNPAQTCGVVPSARMVRRNAIVTIADIKGKVATIDFGCLAGGCVYGPDGEPNSVAPAGYPFPSLRKYSLVIRVGTQVIQGGSSFTFMANQTAVMEVCANDNDMRGNRGAWGLRIEVDESRL